MHSSESQGRLLLERIFRAGVDAVDPEVAVRSHVRRVGSALHVRDAVYMLDDFERVFLIGAGKASAPMAKALEELLDERLTRGLIVVKYGHTLPLKRTESIEAGHPIPDSLGLAGAERILRLLDACTEDDLVICVLSGGASALLPAPVPLLNLRQKQTTTQLLLECGATIGEINTIRKHLSRSKGGGVARAAHPATVTSLILSDVIGDCPGVIASGPTVPDESRFAECVDVVERYGIASSLPKPVWRFLQEGAAGLHPETPKTGDPIFSRVHNVIVGNNRAALIAAKDCAESLGLRTLLLTSCIEGEAREVGQVLASIGKEVCLSGYPLAPPLCVLAGGETTVTLRGQGKGGRCQELALSTAITLDGWSRISLLAAGTDGTDGPTDAAGAYVDGTTCARARGSGLHPANSLSQNDSYHFFQRLGDLLIIGPTRTNVMDLMCLLIQ
ncbi:MAG TPA: glycerate kinase [Syntrophobacteraceae bacterium]|nr:glycerate kinase [Syntrophobacteraceae bacterium]